MKRPTGLPCKDMRTDESKNTSKFLVQGMEGLVDTPTEEQILALDESINRKLELLRKSHD